VGSRPVTGTGAFEEGANGTKIEVLGEEKKMKMYGARRGERGRTGHGANIGFIMVMVNEEQRDAALLNCTN
jgi:hypothetical protein